MGASILWQPITGRSITPGGRSAFVRALGIDNGAREFGPGDLDFLRGMAAATDDFRVSCNALIDAIAMHERVCVWAGY